MPSESTPPRFTARDREALERIERRVVAPYATISAGASRRYEVGDSGRTLDYRTEFQRDRDRILHSLAFRRLKHKTQVYVPYEGDHHRTRLTHTLEVAQVGRIVARALALNEDLVEAIALGHDLGQPPFGTGGAGVLEAILAGDEKVPWVAPQILAATGGFRANYQSLRVVDRLEQRYDHPGINLSDPVREGIWKSAPRDDEVAYPEWDDAGLRPGEPPSLEAQAVIVADRIARLTHDIEDGVRAGEISLTAVERTKVGRAVRHKLGDGYPETLGAYRRRNAQIRGIIHLLVSDVVVRAAALLDPSSDGGDVPEGRDGTTLDFSGTVAPLVDELEDLAHTQVYRSRTVRRLDGRARLFVTGLFAGYYQDPLQLDDYALLRYRAEVGGSFLRDVPAERVDEEIERRYQGRPAFVRVIADHVAGMSDTYALTEYERLYIPFPDPERR